MRNHKHAQWKAYCNTIAQGNGMDATYARICQQIKGTSALNSKRITERALLASRIDGESCAVRFDAVEHIEHMRLAGIQTHVIPTPENDWRECGGGHERIRHIGSVKEDR